MPPPPGIGGIFSFSFFSTTTHSVVRSSPAMDAAFCSAVRVTLVGSMTPAATRSSSSKDYYHRYVLNPEGVSVYVTLRTR